jgi:hypothetical protein
MSVNNLGTLMALKRGTVGVGETERKQPLKDSLQCPIPLLNRILM